MPPISLYNYDTESAEQVNEQDASELLASGNYGINPNQDIFLEDTQGNAIKATPEEATKKWETGLYDFVPKDRYKSPEEKKSESSQKDIATLEGFASSYLTDVPVNLAAKVYSTDEEFQKRKESSEYSAGTMAGYASQLVVPEVALAKLPIGWIGKGGQWVASKFGGAVASKTAQLMAKEGVNKITGQAIRTGTDLAAKTSVLAGATETSSAISDYINSTKDLSAIEIATGTTKRALEAAGKGALLGGVLGAGGSAAYNTMKSVGKKSIDWMMKFANKADVVTEDIVVKYDPILMKTGYDARIPSKTNIPLEKNKETGFWEYKDSAKTYSFDPSKLSGNIINLQSIPELNDLGSKVGMPYLGEVIMAIKPKGDTFIGNIEKEILKIKSFYGRYPVKNAGTIFQAMANVKDKSGKYVFEKVEFLNLIAERDQLEQIMKGLVQRPYNFNQRLNKNIIGFQNFERKLNRWSSKYPSVENFKKAFFPPILKDFAKKASDLIDGYIDDGTLYVINQSVLDNAFIDSSINIKNRQVKLDPRDKYLLRFAGTKGSQIPKLGDKTLKSMSDLIRDTAGFPPTTANISAGTGERLQKASLFIDNALTIAANYIIKNGGRTKVRYDDLAKYIRDTMLPRYVRKNSAGEIELGSSNMVEFLRREEQEFLNPKNLTGGRVDVDLTRDLNADEIHKARVWIDSRAEWTFDPMKNPGKDHLLGYVKEMRTFVENKLIGSLKQIPDPGHVSILEQYLKAKEMYKASFEVLSLLNQVTNREAMRHGLKASDIAGALKYGVVGGGVSGLALGPVGGLVGGALVGSSKWAYNQYGDYFKGLAMEKMGQNASKLDLAMEKAVNNFIKTPSKSIIVMGAGFLAKEDVDSQYQKDKKQIDKLNEDFTRIMQQFNEENEAENDLLPDHMPVIVDKMFTIKNFLFLKIPKSPYPENAGIDWFPSLDQSLGYQRYKQAVLHPKTIIASIESGNISSEELDTLRNVYPELLARMSTKFALLLGKNKLDYNKRILAQRLFGYGNEKTMKGMIGMSRTTEAQKIESQKKQTTRLTSREFSLQKETNNARIANR